MIAIYEGRIGGGKTYKSVEDMAAVFARGGTVATNVQILWDKADCIAADRPDDEGMVKLVESKYGVTPQREQWVDLRGQDMTLFHRHTPAGTKDNQVLVVVDEAHLHFNSRDWAKTEKETLAFLTQSRKQYTDITFISQSATNIDKQFRVLNQFIWRFKDLESARVPGVMIPYPWLCRMLTFGVSQGKHILQNQYDYDGITLVKRHFAVKDPLVFGAYETNALVREFPREGVAKKLELKKVETLWSKIMKQIRLNNENGFGNVKLFLGASVAAMVFLAIGYFAYLKVREMLIGKKQEPLIASAKDKPAPQTLTDTTRTLLASNANQRGVGQNVASTQHEKPMPAYDVYQERFVGFYGRGVLKTDKGEYQAGEMSNKGFVLAVSDRRAKLSSPDGRTAWIVADDLQHAENDSSATKERQVQTRPVDPEDVIRQRWNAIPAPKSVKETTSKMTQLERVRGGYPTEETMNRVAGLEKGTESGIKPMVQSVRVDPTRKFIATRPIGLPENEGLTTTENVIQ
jgi:hypothetical protein